MADDHRGQARAGHRQAPRGARAGMWRPAAQIKSLVFAPFERCDGAREQHAAHQQRSAAIAQALFDDRFVVVPPQQILAADDPEESFVVDGVMVGALKKRPKVRRPTAVLLATAEAFERAGLLLAAYGGLVLATYGAPRETKDADLAVVAATGTEALKALSAAGIESLIASRCRRGMRRVSTRERSQELCAARRCAW